MGKKCIICKEDAILAVKGTSDCYCRDCAEENFDDLSYLEKIDEAEKRKEEMAEHDDDEEAKDDLDLGIEKL